MTVKQENSSSGATAAFGQRSKHFGRCIRPINRLLHPLPHHPLAASRQLRGSRRRLLLAFVIAGATSGQGGAVRLALQGVHGLENTLVPLLRGGVDGLLGDWRRCGAQKVKRVEIAALGHVLQS